MAQFEISPEPRPRCQGLVVTEPRAVAIGCYVQPGIKNFSTGADCAATLLCLKALGVLIGKDDADLLITGVGTDGLREPKAPLDCGNSGTTMRLLAGILAGQNSTSTLTGDESLRSRPM